MTMSGLQGRIGIWRGAAGLSPELAVTLEQLGYSSIWIGGSPGGDLQIVHDLLDATTTLRVATGITNIWLDEPASIGRAFHAIEAAHPGRFTLGVGIGHPEAIGGRYAKPYAALVEYLDGLDEAGVPTDRRVLAALGPKVLKLSADRAGGAHPYLTTPEHTRSARTLLGEGKLLVPEQKFVLDTDVARARVTGRRTVAKPYLDLVNYRNNLLSLGYSEADLNDGGSDELIDALVAHGDAAAVKARLVEHLDAGADEVVAQLLTGKGEDPVTAFTTLAHELFGPTA